MDIERCAKRELGNIGEESVDGCGNHDLATVGGRGDSGCLVHGLPLVVITGLDHVAEVEANPDPYLRLIWAGGNHPLDLQGGPGT